MRTRSLLFAAMLLMTPLAAQAQTYTAWSEPINLGPTVNTSVSENFSCVSKDGLSLYFTSSGVLDRPSVGGTDIYVSRRSTLDEPWGPPENLGEPINSPYDDVSPMLTIDGHRMYFASNRPGGFGGNDLCFASPQRARRFRMAGSPQRRGG